MKTLTSWILNILQLWHGSVPQLLRTSTGKLTCSLLHSSMYYIYIWWRSWTNLINLYSLPVWQHASMCFFVCKQIFIFIFIKLNFFINNKNLHYSPETKQRTLEEVEEVSILMIDFHDSANILIFIFLLDFQFWSSLYCMGY